MSSSSSLSPVQQLVLDELTNLESGAATEYGWSITTGWIARSITLRRGHSLPVRSIYKTLRRLEQGGVVVRYQDEDGQIAWRSNVLDR